MLGQFDQDARGRGRMEKRDAFTFRAKPGHFINQANACGATSVERCIDVVNGEADVMNPWTSFVDVPSDRRIVFGTFEQFNE